MIRRSLVRVLGGAGAAAGGAALAGLLVVGLLGDSTGASYLLGLLGPWWLLPCAGLLVAVVSCRLWVATSLLLVPAVVGLGMVVPHGAPGPVSGTAGKVPLEVATWNITGGADASGVLDLAVESAPDVLVLQEVTAGAREQLRPLATRLPHVSVTRDAWAPPWGEPSAGAVYSRYPITSVRSVDGLPAASRPVDVVVLDVSGTDVAVIGVHLASPCVACSLHPSDPGPAGGGSSAAAVRVAEARRLADVCRELRREGAVVVLAGDVNAADLNEPARELRAGGLVDAKRAVGWGPGATRFEHGIGLARIDVVQVAGAQPVSARVGAPRSSDHAPVLVELLVPALM